MKWFKHHNDLLSRPDSQILLDKFGTKGPYAWIRLLEILAKHLDPETPDTFVESKRHIFNEIFPKCCHKTGKKILDFFQYADWLKYEIYGKEILLECPVIKELADEYTQKILKEKKDTSIGTNSRDAVGTSSCSSSRGY